MTPVRHHYGGLVVLRACLYTDAVRLSSAPRPEGTIASLPDCFFE